LALIAARPAVIDGAATAAAGDPLAIAPDENRLHQSLMRECVGDTAAERAETN